jgi:CheY-like chemotaxis protein
VAEDKAINRVVVTRMLERLGCRVEAVEDGEAALEHALREAPDIVLMDWQMPIMDGMEACRRIRAARDRSEGPKIIALTANAFAADRERCMAAGMDGYLTKPISLAALRQALKDVMADPESGEESPALPGLVGTPAPGVEAS